MSAPVPHAAPPPFPAFAPLHACPPRPVDWLWFQRLPLGKLTLLTGEPGVGKSLLTADLIARVTRGTNFPDDRHAVAPASVMLLAPQDQLADTWRPRLIAAGADLSRVLTASGERQLPERSSCLYTEQTSQRAPGNSLAASPPPLNVERRTSNFERRSDGFDERGVERVNATCPPHDTPVAPDGFDNNPFDVRCSTFDVRRSGETFSENDHNALQTCNRLASPGAAETQTLQGADAPRSPSLATDLEQLDALLAAHPDVRLIVVDPLLAFCDGVSLCHPQAARRMLRELAALAARRHVAVLAVTSLVPRGPARVLARVSGGMAFVEAAQAVWFLARDQSQFQRRLLVPAKMNLTSICGGLALRFVDGRTVWDDERFALSADELLARSSRPRGTSPDADDAQAWLERALFEKPQPAAEVLAHARRNGITASLLRAARERSGVAVLRDGFGPRSRVIWSLEHRREDVDEAANPAMPEAARPPVAEAASFGTIDNRGGHNREKRRETTIDAPRTHRGAPTTPASGGRQPPERSSCLITEQTNQRAPGNPRATLPPPLNVEHRTSNIQRRRDGFDNNPFDVRCSRFDVRRSGEILPENDDNTPQAGNRIVPDEPTETGNIQGAHAPRSPGRATGHDWSDVPDPDELTDWARDRLVLREPAE